MNKMNRRKTDVNSCVVNDAQNTTIDHQMKLAGAACEALQARGFAVWGVFLGNLCPVIRLRWTPACDEVLERGEAMWRRVQTVGRERVYTYVWPFMDCRVEWTLQGDLH